MTQGKKEIVRRYVEEIYTRGNVAIAGDLVTEDYVNHAGFQTVKGVEGLQQFVTMIHTGFPDAHETIEDQIVEGDKEVHRWTIRGTHQGEFMGIAATGKKVEIEGITIARLENGKVAEEWTRADMLGLMQQLGAVGS